MRSYATLWMVLSSLVCISPLSSVWSPPSDLSLPGEEVSNPQIVVDTKGNATAVWYKSNGKDSTIQSSKKPFGEAWQAPVDVSQVSSTDHSPQVVVDPNNNVTIVWWKYKKTKGIIQSSTMPFGGTWTVPDTLSRPVRDAENLQIAIDADGNATAVWAEFNGKKWVVRSSAKPFGGTWQEVPDTLTFGGDNPQIAIDAHGNITAVWQKYETTHNSIQASTKPLGSIWGAPDTLSCPDQDAGSPQIVVNASGCVTAIWRANDGNNRIIQASSRPFGESWQKTPDNLSQSDQDAHHARIAIDTNGTITAVWNGFNGRNWAIQSSTKSLGSPWSIPDNLSQPGQDADLPKIAIDAQGHATAVWRIYDGANWIIQTSTKPFGGSWSSPDNLSQGGQAEESQIAIDALGNITAIWCKKEGSTYTIQAATNVSCSSVADLCETLEQAPDDSLSPTTAAVIDSAEKSPEVSPPPIASPLRDLIESSDEPRIFAPPCTSTSTTGTEPDPDEKESVVTPLQTSSIAVETQGVYSPSTAFIGRGKRTKKKLFLKTKWIKDTTNTIARYEIFARNKRIAKISTKKKAKTTIRLHPHHVPHHLSKGYRIYLHNKYKIRAVDSSGTPSSFTYISVRHG